MTSTRGLVESSLLVALAVALFMASHFLPVVGIAISLVCPAPLVVLGLRHSLGRACLGTLVATIIAGAFLGVTGALFFAFGFGFLGIGLGYLAGKCQSGSDSMLFGVLVSLASKLILMVIMVRLTGINPFSLDPETISATVDRVVEFYRSAGMPEATLKGLTDQFRATIAMLPHIFPALLVMAAAVDCFLSYVISGAVLKRIGDIRLPALPAFEEWRFPKSLFWALLISMGLQLFGSQAGRVLIAAGINIRILVSMLFFFQGVSVVWFVMKNRGLGPVVRWVIVGLLALIPLLSQLVLVAGIVDMWYDLRKRFRR